MNNTSSETFIQDYMMSYKYRETDPKLPERDYNYDGTDHWQKTIDILGVKVWSNWTFEYYNSTNSTDSKDYEK